MSDTQQQIVELLRDTADKIEAEDVTLVRAGYNPPAPSLNQPGRIDIEYWDHD